MVDGSHKMICGKIIKITIAKSNIRKYGAQPLIISPIGLPPDIPCMTKRFIPTGGVIWPNSMSITMNTPNQIKSIPNPSTIGKITGSVR